MTKHKPSCFDSKQFLSADVHSSVSFQPIPTNLVSISKSELLLSNKL